ncbi:uncharacterized protein L3040_000320 [Drepanopeziza brunnea f. sp. 'multigermtubi']|uniref:uncharacterized protein n=1 Tax=Drepanopeziza brunnea f. sp. 'multigermtubi' TaxID=698441 RepID=UPI0023A523BB|nr:hypothetical protein L3040_000320 [Drepanopeziza brunnea f. sp. 'multigermtubi']
MENSNRRVAPLAPMYIPTQMRQGNGTDNSTPATNGSNDMSTLKSQGKQRRAGESPTPSPSNVHNLTTPGKKLFAGIITGNKRAHADERSISEGMPADESGEIPTSQPSKKAKQLRDGEELVVIGCHSEEPCIAVYAKLKVPRPNAEPMTYIYTRKNQNFPKSDMDEQRWKDLIPPNRSVAIGKVTLSSVLFPKYIDELRTATNRRKLEIINEFLFAKESFEEHKDDEQHSASAARTRRVYDPEYILVGSHRQDSSAPVQAHIATHPVGSTPQISFIVSKNHGQPSKMDSSRRYIKDIGNVLFYPEFVKDTFNETINEILPRFTWKDTELTVDRSEIDAESYTEGDGQACGSDDELTGTMVASRSYPGKSRDPISTQTLVEYDSESRALPRGGHAVDTPSNMDRSESWAVDLYDADDLPGFPTNLEKARIASMTAAALYDQQVRTYCRSLESQNSKLASERGALDDQRKALDLLRNDLQTREKVLNEQQAESNELAGEIKSWEEQKKRQESELKFQKDEVGKQVEENERLLRAVKQREEDFEARKNALTQRPQGIRAMGLATARPATPVRTLGAIQPVPTSPVLSIIIPKALVLETKTFWSSYTKIPPGEDNEGYYWRMANPKNINIRGKKYLETRFLLEISSETSVITNPKLAVEGKIVGQPLAFSEKELIQYEHMGRSKMVQKYGPKSFYYLDTLGTVKPRFFISWYVYKEVEFRI